MAPEEWTNASSFVNLSEAWYGTVYDMSKSVELSTSGVETIVFASEMMNEWFLGNYYHAGYFYGSSIANAHFMLVEFFILFMGNIRDNMPQS